MYDVLRAMGVRSQYIRKLRDRQPLLYNADGHPIYPAEDAPLAHPSTPEEARDAPTYRVRQAFTEHPKQKLFAEAAFSGKYNFLLFGGAIRGGKTFIAMAIIFILCKIFPGSRWAIIRKSYPALRRNTIPAFNKLRPPGFVGPINYTTWTSTCTNGSQIILLPEALKEDPDLNRFRGLEVNGFLPEEMNELEEETFHKMVERAGTWIIPNRQEQVAERDPDTGRPTGRMVLAEVESLQPKAMIIGTCNPADNWVKRIFYDPWEKGRLEPPFFYCPSSPYDNPHLPPDYLPTLEKVMREEDQRKFLRGDWSVADNPRKLIKLAWILKAQQRSEELRSKTVTALGVDVARGGKAHSVLAFVSNRTLVRFEEYHKTRLTYLAEIVIERINALGIAHGQVRIDAVGLGASIVDACYAQGMEVVSIVAGGRAFTPVRTAKSKSIAGIRKPFVTTKVDLDLLSRSSEVIRTFLDPAFPYRFKDFRAQMYWLFARKLENEEFFLPDDLDPRCIEELTTIEYEIKSDRTIWVQPKEEIEENLGRSTDHADALVMAAFDLPVPVNTTPLQGTISARLLR